MGITLAQAKRLGGHDVVYEIGEYLSDGSPRAWRVNGMPKTWKKDPTRVEVPLKFGLYAFGRLTESNLKYFTLRRPKPLKGSRADRADKKWKAQQKEKASGGKGCRR